MATASGCLLGQVQEPGEGNQSATGQHLFWWGMSIINFAQFTGQLVAQSDETGREEIFLAFIEIFNLVVALVALYFAIRILPVISRDARKRSWLFLSLAVITFAVAEIIGALKEIGNFDLEFFYESTEAVFTILLAMGFYYLFTTDYRETLKLRSESTTDELTRLYSPSFFDTYLQKRITSVKKEGAQLSIMFLGIDDLEAYKEKYGRQETDYVLKKVADIIQEEMRDEDSRGEEVACRYGSEYFTLLLGFDFNAAGRIAERLRYSIKMGCSTFTDPKLKTSLTTSIGLASYGRDADSDSELMEIAEARMHEAEKRGKNRVYIGDDGS